MKISWEKKQLCDIRFPAERCYPGRYKSFEKFAFMHPRERERERHLGVSRAGSAIMENHIRVSWGENFLLMH